LDFRVDLKRQDLVVLRWLPAYRFDRGVL